MAEQAALSPARARKPRTTLKQRNSLLGYALVAPLLLCLAILVFYPFIFGVAISFTNREVGTEGRFVGLANFIYLMQVPSFQKSIVNTIVLVFWVQALKLVFGLGIAILLNQAIRGRKLWRGMILLPWAMPAFVAYLTWQLMYAPQGGAFNLISVGLGFGKIDFLSKDLAMPSVIFATFWRGFPFWVISFLAALQGVSQELYEAAAIDGANAMKRFRHITIPAILPVVLVVVLLSTIWTTNGFENVWLITQGGPSDATMTFPVLAYFGMQTMRIGEAAAVSVTLMPIFAIMAFVGVKVLERD
jgi:ABC-type sugar transport system permease subunit